MVHESLIYDEVIRMLANNMQMVKLVIKAEGKSDKEKAEFLYGFVKCLMSDAKGRIKDNV